jgi:hypothetical protein
MEKQVMDESSYFDFEDDSFEEYDEFDDMDLMSDEFDFSDEEDDFFEYEDQFDAEGDEFFKKLARRAKKFARRVAKIAAPIAKKLIPLAGKAIGGAFGGPAGAMIGGNLGGLLSNLEDDGYDALSGDYEDDEDSPDEMDGDGRFLGLDSDDEELAEAMVDAAAKATSATDASALAAASASTVAKKAAAPVKKVTPVIASASGRLATVMRRDKRAKPLTKAIAQIQARTVETLNKKAAKGKPVTPKTAKRVMMKHTAKVLSSPREIAKTVAKNEVKRRQFDRKAVMRAEKFA